VVNNSTNINKTKEKFKQWSTIQQISIKQTITSHLNWTHCTQKDHDMWRGNRGPDLGQSHKCGGLVRLMGYTPSSQLDI